MHNIRKISKQMLVLSLVWEFANPLNLNRCTGPPVFMGLRWHCFTLVYYHNDKPHSFILSVQYNADGLNQPQAVWPSSCLRCRTELKGFSLISPWSMLCIIWPIWNKAAVLGSAGFVIQRWSDLSGPLVLLRANLCVQG